MGREEREERRAHLEKLENSSSLKLEAKRLTGSSPVVGRGGGIAQIGERVHCKYVVVSAILTVSRAKWSKETHWAHNPKMEVRVLLSLKGRMWQNGYATYCK